MSIYIENFETITGNKSNIQALRNKVLELALKGNLVEQDTNGEPVSELVKRINVERNELIKEGKIKKQKPLSSICEDEIPFEIPKSWKWCRVGEVTQIYLGLTHRPDYVEAGIPFLSVKDISAGSLSFEKCRHIEKSKFDIMPSGSKPIRGDVLFGRVGTLGKPVIVNVDYPFGIFVSLGFLRPFIESMNKYLKCYMESNLFFQQIYSNTFGMAQINLNTGWLSEFLIPLPPIAEQIRIVTKIESLMSEIDKLVKSLQKKEHIMELLPEAVVEVIGNCQTGEELKEKLHFIIENFNNVYQTPKSLQELRNVILQLAIEGKLLPQDTTDEPALELVKRIKNEKDKLMKDGRIKKQNSNKPIEEAEIPFEIPASWRWVRLGDICKKIGSGSTPTGGKSVYNDNGIMFIRSQNVYNCGLRLSNVAFIDESINNKMCGSQVEGKDILLNITGASIGRCCVVPDDFGCANVNQHVTIIRLIDSSMKDFIQMNIISNYIQKLIMNAQVGVSREGLSGIKLSNFIIPLPPKAEQKRIVQKVESIMNLIDQMENKLKRKTILVEKMARV